MKLTENDLKYLQKPEGIWEWRRPSKGDRYRGYRRTIAGELGVVKQISDTPRKALKQLHILRGELEGYRWCAPRKQEGPVSYKQLDKLKAPSTVLISPEGKIKVSKNDLLNYGIAYLQSKLGGVSIEIEEEEEKGVSDEEFEDMKEQLVNYFGRKSK